MINKKGFGQESAELIFEMVRKVPNVFEGIDKNLIKAYIKKLDLDNRLKEVNKLL